MAFVFKRSKKKGAPYYASWREPDPKRPSREIKRMRSTQTSDYQTAMIIAKNYESQAALRRHNIIDPRQESIAIESRKSVETHLSDLRIRCGRRTEQMITLAERVVSSSPMRPTPNWEVGLIDADSVNRFVIYLRELKRSARTIQAHITALKSFTSWLAKHSKLTHDPLLTITKPNVSAAREYQRRMLRPDEWPWLLKGIAMDRQQLRDASE